MMFAKKPGKHIVKLDITINLDALPDWLQSGEAGVPIVPFTQWSQHRTFDYRLFRLPAETDKDCYFHQHAAEYSHSFNAIINLRERFADEIDIQSVCEGGSADLELRLWRGQMSIGFNQRLILVAPLNEMVMITNTGKTSLAAQQNPREQRIEVPIGFDKGQPTTFMSLYETIGPESAGYSNQLVHFSLKPATDSVRS